MKTIVILTALLGHHVHDTAAELADEIDWVCGTDRECKLDAVATCYVETRCQMNLNGRTSSAAGPFQQMPRYADHPALAGLPVTEIARRLNSDPRLAAEQWKSKRDRYRRRHGESWPLRYHGGDTRAAYYERWQRVRARAGKVK